jgi:hypothetical protein
MTKKVVETVFVRFRAPLRCSLVREQRSPLGALGYLFTVDHAINDQIHWFSQLVLQFAITL